MARHVPLASEAMETQVGLREFRLSRAPLFEAALRSGSHAAISEAHALAATLHVAEKQARRLAGIADGLVICADGLFEPGHGRAA